MAERDATKPDEKQTPFDKCDPNCESGPVREGGGTTGAGNLSPGQASRTGGATGGVAPQNSDPAKARNVQPDA